MPETITQANAWRLETDVSEEECQAWGRALAEGRGRLRLRRPDMGVPTGDDPVADFMGEVEFHWFDGEEKIAAAVREDAESVWEPPVKPTVDGPPKLTADEWERSMLRATTGPVTLARRDADAVCGAPGEPTAEWYRLRVLALEHEIDRLKVALHDANAEALALRRQLALHDPAFAARLEATAR